jgi:hypothetical protein
MKKSAYSLIFLSLSLIALMAITGFNYFVDPFTYYHQPWTSINLSKNQRYANAGLARNYEYRTILLGTSHVMELESSRLSEIVAEPALNLSISAARIREQAILAELALKQGKVQTILWEMNFPSFGFGDVVGLGGDEFPTYLYSPTIETPYRYLLSFDTLLLSLDALKNPGQVTIDNRNEISAREFSEQRVLESWKFGSRRLNPIYAQSLRDLHESVESPQNILKKRLLPLLSEHPEVQFKLFLPPGSVLLYLMLEAADAGEFTHLLEFRDTLAALVSIYPNVELYDFQADWGTVMNLNLFRDLAHFDHNVMEGLFTRIQNGEMRVNETQLIENTSQLKNQVYQYGKSFCAEDTQRCNESLKTRLDNF